MHLSQAWVRRLRLAGTGAVAVIGLGAAAVVFVPGASARGSLTRPSGLPSAATATTTATPGNDAMAQHCQRYMKDMSGSIQAMMDGMIGGSSMMGTGTKGIAMIGGRR